MNSLPKNIKTAAEMKTLHVEENAVQAQKTVW